MQAAGSVGGVQSVQVLDQGADVKTGLETEAPVRDGLLVIAQGHLLLPEVRARAVDAQHEGVHGGLELLLLGLEVLLPSLLRALVHPPLDLLDLGLHLLAVALSDLALVDLLHGFPGAFHVNLQRLLRHRLAARKLVLIFVLFGLFQHGLDLGLRQSALLVGDLDVGLLVRLHVLGGHFQDPVGVNVKGHLDLGHPAQGLRNVAQRELPEVVVVLDHGALALVDLDVHVVLVVFSRREVLALVRGDRAVALDELLHHPARHLDAQRERGDVEQEHVLHLLRTSPRDDRRLDSSAVGHSFVWVDILAELLAVEEGLDQILDLGDPRGAAHHDHLRNLGLGETAVCEALAHWLHGLLEVVHVKLLKLCPRHTETEVVALV
mmetsp:Transcript_30674/g.96534  ORF Transcript_30674/g.96534 Transcript_30674/m.96534 type:complete len:378 (+) Transcript_30674:39-1172(+)